MAVKRFRRPLLTVTMLMLALLFVVVRRTTAQSVPGAALRAAWERTEKIGSYDFTTELTETTYPAPRITAVGRSAKYETLYLKGTADREAGLLNLSLWDDPSTILDTNQALEVRIEGTRAFGRPAGGAWEEIPDFSGAFAPTGDAAAFLNAARNVRMLGAETRSVPFGKGAFQEIAFERYAFTLDGERYAENMRAMLQEQLQASGELPAGISLGTSDHFRNAVGEGEAWIDANGLPLRMTVEIEFPQDGKGERTFIDVQTDFVSYHDTAALDRAAFTADPLGAITGRLPDLAATVGSLAPAMAIVTLLGGAFVFSMRQPKKAYNVVATALILQMAFGPLASLLDAARMDKLLERFPRAEAAEHDSGGEVRSPATGEWDPRQSPLEAGRAAYQQEQSAVAALDKLDRSLFSDGRPDRNPNGGSLLANSGIDLDEDGLFSDEEAGWTTSDTNPDSDGDGIGDGAEVALCPVRDSWSDPANAEEPACADPYYPDTDGDGLTDGEEILFLGTYARDADSDHDGISDYNEVHGFVLAPGATPRYYTDARDPDTDGDGILDGVECLALGEAAPWTANTICEDTQNKGVADVLSLDNDGDGVPNSSDFSPYTLIKPAGYFSATTPLRLLFYNITPTVQLLVDIQIRPVITKHLSYAHNVLDWPTGDNQGQIQRLVDSTFGDQDPNIPLDNPAYNGDMRLTPMLEFSMPGNSLDLPRKAADHSVQVTDAGRLEGLVTFAKVSDTETLLVVSMLRADDATLTILDGSCLNGGSIYTTPVYQSFSHAFPGVKLGDYADGGHSLQVEAGEEIFCEPIPSVVEGSERVDIRLQRPGDPLGTVRVQQSGTNTTLTFDHADDGQQYDAFIYNSSCAQQTNLQHTLTTLFDGAVRTIPNSNAVDLADGNHSILYRNTDKTFGCAPLGNIVNGALPEMIDLDKLAPYEISVMEDLSGNLVAMAPLSLQEDPVTGEKVAFNGRMLYQRGTTAPLDNNVNLVWVLTMLTDHCPEDDCSRGDTDQSQIMHTYRDESWYVTGLSLQEELGLDVAVVFENPRFDYNTDTQFAANRNLEFDDNLWWLARNLQRTFISGRDHDGDDARDIKIGDIKDRWDESFPYSHSDVDRFFIRPDALDVAEFHYEGQADLAELNSVEIPAILSSAFMTGTWQREDLFHRPVTTLAPTLLFAREERNRTLGLDELAGTNGLVAAGGNWVQMNMNPAFVEPVVMTSLSWKPFRYNAAYAAWEAYPIVDYWNRMERLFTKAPGFSADLAKGAGESLDPQTIAKEGAGDAAAQNAAYEATANLLMAQNIYLYLYQGVANAVEMGGELMFQVSDDDNPSDQDLADDAAFVVTQGQEASGFMVQYASEMYEPLVKEYARYKKLKGRPTKRLVPGEELTLKGAIGRAHEQAWSEVTADIREALDQFDGSTLPGRLHKAGVVGIAAGSIAMGIASNFFDADSDNASERAVALTFLSIDAASNVYEGMQTVKAYKAWKLFRPDKAFGVKAFSTTLSPTKAAKIAAVIGAVIEVGIAFGIFLSQMLDAGVAAFSLAFNEALASFVATAIVAALMVALAFTGIGALIVAVIAIFDALVALICGLAPPDKESEDLDDQVYTYFCKGISGLLTELVAFLIYDQTDIIKIDDSSRIKFISFNPYLVNPGRGFVPDAALAIEAKIRNTIETASPNGIGVGYFFQFNESNSRTATFNYEMVAAEVEDEDEQLHNKIERGEHPDEWIDIGGDTYYIERTILETNNITLPEPGINQPVDAFFAEGYQSPTQECVVPYPVTVPICWVRSHEKSSYNDLKLVFDIFPSTLSGFYELVDKDGGRALAWGQSGELTFPMLLDADGDGLLFASDPDDDTADNDGDGLDDLREIQIGTDPDKSDTDGDLVDDGDEILEGTDPLQQDSDSDGLDDAGEREGWMITYNLAGDMTRVWSDPLSADADGDTINDRREKALGFSPWVANDPTVLSYDTDLREKYAPLLLLRLDEGDEADSFIDSARPDSVYAANCGGDLCPTSAVTGMIGNAAAFDGQDDFLTLGVVKEVNTRPGFFTVAAWVRPNHTTGTQYVMGTSRHLRDDGFAFGLKGNEIGFDLFPDYPLVSTGAAIPIGEWTHIAAVAFKTTDDRYGAWFYKNGVFIDEYYLPVGENIPEDSSDELLIGAVYQHNEYAESDPKPFEEPYVTEFHFDGRIDEVALYGASRSGADLAPLIQSLFEGRYNPDDGVVARDQVLEYETNLRNRLLGRSVEGLLTTNLPDVLTPVNASQFRDLYEHKNFVLGPRGGSGGKASELHQVIDLSVKGDAPSGDYEIIQEAGAIVDVPAVKPAGQFTNTVLRDDVQRDFNGLNEWLGGESADYRLDNQDFTIALWVKPAGISGRRGIFGLDSGEPLIGSPENTLGYPSLLIEDGKIVFGFGAFDPGQGKNRWMEDASAVLSELQIGKWTHIVVSYDASIKKARLYIDGFYKQELGPYAGNPNSTSSSFNLGRSTNIGRIYFNDITIMCEDDGGGVRFDLVGFRPEEAEPRTLIWGKDYPDEVEDPDPPTENIGEQVMFREYMDFAMCENDTDDSNHATCDGDDDFMGRERYHVYFPETGPILDKEFSTSRGDSDCDWRYGYDDWVLLDYNFSHNALPYAGLTKDLRLIKSTVDQAAVTNLLQSNEVISRFKFNDRPGSKIFEDDVAATSANCEPTNQNCPVSGVEGRENVGLYFLYDPNGNPSFDQVALKGVSNLIKRHIDTPGSNGYSFGVWVKPEDTGLNVMTVLEHGSNIKLILVKSTQGEYYHPYYWDADLGLVGLPIPLNIGTWHHLFVTVSRIGTVNLYVDGAATVASSYTTQFPTETNPFFYMRLGFGSYGGPTPYKGAMDDLYFGKNAATPAQVAAIYRGVPANHWRLDEDGSDLTTNLDGQIAESLVITDTRGYSDPLGTAGGLGLWNSQDFTVAGWVRPSDITMSGQEVYRPLLGSPNGAYTLLFMGLHDGKPLLFYDGRGLDGLTRYWIEADQAIPPDQWTHLAFRNEAEQITIYVNGRAVKNEYIGSLPGGSTGSIYLGEGYVGHPTNADTHWMGRVDDVAIYRRALIDEELVNLYNFQVTWVDEERRAPFAVDADLPTGNLKTLPPFMPKKATVFMIEAQDSGSAAVAGTLYGTDMGQDNTSAISRAAPCLDTSGAAALCTTFDPPAEGQYSFSLRVIDQVGNQSDFLAQDERIVVDDSLPLVTLNPLPATPFRPDPVPGEAALWSLNLSGTVTDSQILYEFDTIYGPGSGVDELIVTIYDANGEPAGQPAGQLAAIDGGVWSLGYQMRHDNPTGHYTGEIVAVDAVGNRATFPIPSFTLDATDPQACWSFSCIAAGAAGAFAAGAAGAFAAAGPPIYLGSGSIVTGTVSETPPDAVAQDSVSGVSAVQMVAEPRFTHGSPLVNAGLPAGTRLYLPFDKSGASETIADTTFTDLAAGLTVSCGIGDCPLSGSATRNGQGLQFDGDNDVLSLPFTPSVGGLTSDFIVGAWIKPKPRILTQGATILATSRANGVDGFSFGINEVGNIYFYIYDWGAPSAWSRKVQPDVWTHVAAHLKDNNEIDFYENGILIETATGVAPIIPDTDDILLIGAEDSFGITYEFEGLLDELFIVEGGLAPDEWDVIMGRAPTVHLTFDDPTNQSIDSAGMGSTVQLLDDPTPGIVGSGALLFPHGQFAHIDGPNGPAGVLPDLAPFTISFWARDFDAFNLFFGPHAHFMKQSGGNFLHHGPEGDCDMPLGDTAGWHHLAVATDGATPLNVYWDGALVSAGAGCPVVTNLGAVYNLILDNSGDGPLELDDFRVYQHALLPLEISSLFQSSWHDVWESGKTTFTTTDAPVAIPDGSGVEVCQSIEVSGIGKTDLAALTVQAALGHTWVGDLILTLVTPSDGPFVLFDQPGYTSGGYGYSADLSPSSPVSFFDGAATPAENMGGTLADPDVICRDDGLCAYQPETDPFAGLVTADGTWQLCASDQVASYDGNLETWNITFEDIPVTNFTTTDAPVAIPDGAGTDVCQSIDVSGIGEVDLAGAVVEAAINQTWVGDLILSLVTPGDETFTLFDRPGYPGGTYGYSSNLSASSPVRFFEGAATPAENMGGGLPDSGVICQDNGLCDYQPETGPFSGPLAADGTWQLCANDNAAPDPGTLQSWSISFPAPQVTEKSWSGSLPPDLEGYYDLKVRGADEAGNVDEEPPVQWSGVIDTLSPRFTLTETVDAGAWRYLFIASDFTLQEETLLLPAACNGHTTILARETYQAPWYQAFAAQTSGDPADLERLVLLEGLCEISAPLPEDAAFSICDIAGNAGGNLNPSSCPAIPVPEIAFTAASVVVNEGDGVVNLNVELVPSANTTVKVNYATVPGTADAGVDYVSKSGTLTFAPGVITQTIPITILEDEDVEGGQSFTVVLSAPDGGVLGSSATTTVTINDNDVVIPVAAFATGSITVNESDGVANLTVNIAPATTVTVTVGYATSSGTAIAGEDYVTESGTLTFAPGVLSRTIAITIIDDEEVEGDQSFSVILNTPNGLTLGNPASVTVTIGAHEERTYVFLPMVSKK